MYNLFARYVGSAEYSTPENPYAAVEEYQDIIYGFWVRPVNYCHHVSGLMKNAMDKVFRAGYFPDGSEILKPDEVIDRVLREWTKEVVAYHEGADLPFSPDIFRKYQFEMHVIVIPPQGEMRIVRYDMNGILSDWPQNGKKLKSDGDLITISLSRSQNFLEPCDPRHAGILCFRDQAPTGIRNTQNQYIYDWQGLILNIALKVAENDVPGWDQFDGSFLLVVDMDKLNAYRERNAETRPYIHVESYDGKFAFYAAPGKIRFSDMECLEGEAPSGEEYLEITAVTDASVRLMVPAKYLDSGIDCEVELKKGDTLTFQHTQYDTVTLADGDFDFAHASMLKLAWSD